MIQFKKRFGKDALVAWSLILPSAIWVLVFTLFPVLYCFYISFGKVNLFADSYEFVGLQNYIQSFNDPVFRKSLLNTIVFSAGSIAPSMALAVVFAVLLSGRYINHGKTFIRATYFLPSVLPVIAVAQVWLWIYEPTYGLLNFALEKLGLINPMKPPMWLSSPDLAMFSIIIFSIWKSTGYNMVIYLARIQDIPRHLYEAASIDGANVIQQFRYVTLPELRPATFFVLTTSIINSFQTFSEVYALTEGGPVNATNMIAYYLYQYAFQFFKLGRGAAVSVVLFIILFIVTVTRWHFQQKSEMN